MNQKTVLGAQTPNNRRDGQSDSSLVSEDLRDGDEEKKLESIKEESEIRWSQELLNMPANLSQKLPLPGNSNCLFP